MVGNLGPDNSGRIYVEFDYNNLIVVDPNKTIDAVGNIRERLVDHENLVMYANLEADVLPRTKLAVGISPEDSGLTTISVAKMNFLKPTKNSYLGSGYYDELTGNNVTKFDGTNQPAQLGQQTSNGAKPYIQNTVANELNVMDNGLLGITSINITTNTSFIPSVTMVLEDVQGKALFQLGNNSPYSAFFNLPYPPFYLTLKGFYGQAVRYQLNLEKFHASFNGTSGNYQVNLTFKGYKFNILNEIAMGHLVATPHMYSQRFNFGVTPVTPQQSNKANESQSKTQGALGANNPNSSDAVVTELVTERGYQKIVEVYSEYKAKGLISPDLPELTLVQLMAKLESFEKNITNSFDKTEVESLTNIKNYKGILTQYFTNVRGGQSSWFNIHLNPQPLILLNGEKVYKFKNVDEGAKKDAIELLKGNITEYNNALAANPTLGTKGKSPIPNPIKYDLMLKENLIESQIDWRATTIAQTGNPDPTKETIDKVISSYGFSQILNVVEVNGKKTYTENKEPYYIFEGDGRFDATISSLETQANKKLSEYEAIITAELLRKIEDKDKGIGFSPTVRNIVAVIMASAEAFVRLLDDVHTKAWDVKYDPVRKAAILENPSSAPSSETVDNVVYASGSLLGNTDAENAQIPVYPWPQFFVESVEDKKGRFQLKYIADPSVVGQTQGNNYSKWPEVEFVEEYMKGLTQKFQNPLAPSPVENQRVTNSININAIEFPSLGIAYANKEEIKFFYEIWERQFLTSHYSGLVRANLNQINDLLKLNIETEVNNIKDSLGVSSPYITFKLKNYGFNSKSYPVFLNNISNMGTGRAYQDYIRDFFVTPYIRALTETPFSILKTTDLGKIPQVTTTSDALRALITNASNEPLVVDTLPYTDPTWNLNNLNQSASATANQVYDTKKSLTIFEPRKIISNFTDIYNYKTNRPVTSFSYLLSQNPSIIAGISGVFGGSIPGLTTFYPFRNPKDFVATEGYCNGVTPTGFLGPRTTTSMLNTPYFINAIQSGVANFKNKETYPYVQAAYLFLNSLPLATLREKYKTVSDNNPPTDLDYIASCFNKFGAIHKIPYAWILKYGSIYHRYKKFKESGVDILTNVWKDFDYTNNYNPITNQTTTQYTFKYLKEVNNTNITLQTETNDDVNMQVGFYPKLINDFNIFYNGYDLYSGYTSEEIQQSVNPGGMKIYNFLDSNILSGKQGNKNLRLKTWSVLLPDLTPEAEANCNPKNNTKNTDYLVVPSFGTSFNQAKESCLTGSTTSPGTKINLTSNSSVYNGSVRCLWAAPNYGYFDSTQIAYPQPDSYLTRIVTGTDEEQSPVHFLNTDQYSKIEEMFSVFDKKVLESFEVEFLNFCKPITNADNGGEVLTYGQSPVNINSNFRNFQSLFKTLMTVPKQVDGTGENVYFDIVIQKQWEVFQSGVKSFMEYDMIIRNGNPSNYNRRIFDSYLSFNASPEVIDPITFNPYVVGSLPTRGGGVTLTQSKLANRQAWFALETEVGFSTIFNVAYSSNGSYITDFFVDNNIEFTAQNVVLLAKIIKMYATQKLRQPTISVAQFKNQITQYLNRESELQNNFLDGVLTGLNRALPSQQQLPQQQPIQSSISGEQSKVENYEVFKALNDKWIAGGDYTNKTLFEDMMFLDRASRNIGDTILVDIFDLKAMFGVGGTPGEYSLNQAMSVYTFISGILIKNNFNVMNLPAYVNFYNVQDADGTTTPRTEGSLDFADSLWGTYLDVDYRKSGPKMVCFYAGKPSQYLDLPKGNFKFRNDGFEMRRASENPLLEDQKDKKDWAVSNKCVGFTVDLGIRNQNIFYSFSVSQDNGTATSESINTQLNMVDQASGRQTATQNNSLYNLYKQRSYKCSVTSLGNALIQPTMYFNLRHVPMFNGPYLIQDVVHSITPGNFQTQFTGIRQGIFDLPQIDKYLQSINRNLLTKLEAIVKNRKEQADTIITTDAQKAANTQSNANNSPSTENSCVAITSYLNEGFESVKVTGTTVNPQTMYDEIVKVLKQNSPVATVDNQMIKVMYSICYVTNYKNNVFDGYSNNYSTPINLETNFSPTYKTANGGTQYFNKTYSCVKVSEKKQLPVANFDTLNDFVSFLYARLKPNQKLITKQGLWKYYNCDYPRVGYVSSSTFESTKLTSPNYQETLVRLTEGVQSLRNFGVDITDIKELISGTTATAAQTVSSKCPPPTIIDFNPKSAFTGDTPLIIITGTSLFGKAQVLLSGITGTIKSNTDTFIQFTPRKNVTGKIKVKTEGGEDESDVDFVFRNTR